MEIGIYVHIPFCVSKCYYCDFTSYANREHEYKTYVDALINEINSHAKKIKEPIIAKTIFIGGGTPSVLPPFLLEKIFIAIKETFIINDDTEYTIETNPGTLTYDKLLLMKDYGVNRISIGVQAYQDKLLKSIGRIHTFNQFLENYSLCKDIGFNNINVDLMFGLPSQTFKEWEETLIQISKLRPEHISAYSLIIEDGTPFGDLFNKGLMQELDEDIERKMYHYTKEYLASMGYQQYEISNFAKNDKSSKHNILYWKAKPYIGIGLGAHSYLEGERYNNTYDINKYIRESCNLNNIQENQEIIDVKTAMAEYMFLGLRLNEGILDTEFINKFNVSPLEVYKEQINNHIRDGLLIRKNGRTVLTEFGQDVSNIVFSSFL